EAEGSDADLVAGPEGRLLDALPVDVGSVAAAEILDEHLPLRLDDGAVPARDLTQRDAQVARLAASDRRDVVGKCKTPAIGLVAQEHQRHVHSRSGSGTAVGRRQGWPCGGGTGLTVKHAAVAGKSARAVPARRAGRGGRSRPQSTRDRRTLPG